MEIARVFFSSRDCQEREDYGLILQLRDVQQKAFLANIAEAFGRRSNKDKSRVYDISRSEALKQNTSFEFHGIKFNIYR